MPRRYSYNHHHFPRNFLVALDCHSYCMIVSWPETIFLFTHDALLISPHKIIVFLSSSIQVPPAKLKTSHLGKWDACNATLTWASRKPAMRPSLGQVGSLQCDPHLGKPAMRPSCQWPWTLKVPRGLCSQGFEQHKTYHTMPLIKPNVALWFLIGTQTANQWLSVCNPLFPSTKKILCFKKTKQIYKKL